MHEGLQVHPAAVIAPILNLVELGRVGGADVEFEQSEIIVGSLLLAKTQLGAVLCGEVGEYVAVEELGEDFQVLFGIRRGWCGRGRDGYCGRFWLRGEAVAEFLRGFEEKIPDKWDLLKDDLLGQGLTHEGGHELLQGEPVKTADHHDAVDDQDQGGHGASGFEAAMKKN